MVLPGALQTLQPPFLTSDRLNRHEKLDLFLFGTFYLQAILFLAAHIITITTILYRLPTVYPTALAVPLLLYLALSNPTTAIAGLYKNSSLR